MFFLQLLEFVGRKNIVMLFSCKNMVMFLRENEKRMLTELTEIAEQRTDALIIKENPRYSFNNVSVL